MYVDAFGAVTAVASPRVLTGGGRIRGSDILFADVTALGNVGLDAMRYNVRSDGVDRFGPSVFNLNGNGGSSYLPRFAAGATSSRGLHTSLSSSTVGGTLLVARLPGTVPEPATWATMLIGFGLTGHALRRKRPARRRTARV